jgi:dihydroxyacetone kinase phosphotransfer subunit
VPVGLVVVSHSRALGEAVRDLGRDLVPGGGPRIEVAAGLDATTLGTDAVAVAEAVRAADDGDGVVVLMDLGSALLSAETALELLDADVRERVTLSAAPLVEGLVSAAIAAAGGAHRAAVAAEAARSLEPKSGHLDAAAVPAVVPAGAGGVVVEVTDPHGLHARPAARMIAALAGLDATVELANATTGAGPVPADSPTAVAGLGVRAGHRLEVHARGPRSAEAVERVRAAVGGSSGQVTGPVRRHEHARLDLPSEPDGPPEAEQDALAAAREAARAEITAVRERARALVGDDAAAVFDTHLQMLDDPSLLRPAAEALAAGEPAARAWASAVVAVEQQLTGLADPYLRARAADVCAVGDAVLQHLLGVRPAPVDGTGVVVAADLTPADVVGLDAEAVTGVLLAAGSRHSHASIIARSRGLAWVPEGGDRVLDLADGTVVELDPAAGTWERA